MNGWSLEGMGVSSSRCPHEYDSEWRIIADVYLESIYVQSRDQPTRNSGAKGDLDRTLPEEKTYENRLVCQRPAQVQNIGKERKKERKKGRKGRGKSRFSDSRRSFPKVGSRAYFLICIAAIIVNIVSCISCIFAIEALSSLISRP
jgi:hypothetical protein